MRQEVRSASGARSGGQADEICIDCYGPHKLG